MNKLKEYRGETRQADFLKTLGLPHITGPLYSLMESGRINPTPEDRQKIADYYGVDVADIWPEELCGQAPEIALSEFINGHGADYYASVVCRIPIGKENAISRESLSALCWMDDRIVREKIRAARLDGHRIISLGKGYYYEPDDREVIRWSDREYRRAISTIVMRSAMLRHTDGRQVEGQIKAACKIKAVGDAGTSTTAARK